MVFFGIQILILVNSNFCYAASTYESFTKVTPVTVSGTSLAFFNDRGMPFFAVGDQTANVQLSWLTPRPTDTLANILPNHHTISERTDLAAMNFGTSLDYVSS
jgi:hypothetical protein